MQLWNYIKENMQRHPKQIICEDNAAITYEDMVIFAETYAKKLRGVQCCAILCQSEMAAGMALLSCLAAGVTALPLSMRYGHLHSHKILRAISPDAILVNEGSDLVVYAIQDHHYIPPKEHPALILCTSGTTGKPKGAMLGEGGLLTNIRDILSYFPLQEQDTILISRPLYHSAVLTGEFLSALAAGTKIRFTSAPFNPIKLLSLIEEHKISVFCGTPTMLSILSKCKRKTPCDTLEKICISGECMDRATARQVAKAFPKSQIFHVYGLTEASPRVSYLPPHLFKRYGDCVGIPLDSVSVKVLKKDGTECTPGEDGLLWVRGKNVMLGYYQNPKLSTKTIRKGWLCTGDIAQINRAGLLKIRGRADNLIIRAGMNIYPAEIEAVLKQNPRVDNVLAYGYKDHHGTHIGLKIVGKFGSAEQVRRLCARLLPPFQIPEKIEIVENLPRTGSGKLSRRHHHG